MKFDLAIRGELRQHMSREKNVIGRGVKAGVARGARAMQRALRNQVRRAGLSEELEKAWQINVYPPQGFSPTAAAVVYSRAPRIHAAFMSAHTVTVKNAKWLAIPLQPAINRGWDVDMHRSSGSRARKWSNVSRAIRQIDLTFIRLSDDRAILAEKKNGDRRPLAYFLLLKQTKHKKLLDFARPARRWAENTPRYVVDAMAREDRKR